MATNLQGTTGNLSPAMTKFCAACGATLHVSAELCPHCGAPQQSFQTPRKDRIVAVLLALFLGGIGIHKFYLGRTLAGVLYLVFFWTCIPAFIALIEGIIYLVTSEQDFHAKYG